ncbi:hypothetical protein JZ751_023091 [Albula glossodonta]|uniref:Uncharacterized protein n=1 Tax=Albula glossodonta TaxID=121402 RepID=A0A8T2PI12_9TELE|nr:hypothetical protein JZ751_023091 [Albula glossodonta]
MGYSMCQCILFFSFFFFFFKGGGLNLPKGFLIWAVLFEHTAFFPFKRAGRSFVQPVMTQARLTSSLIGRNQFLQEPLVINVRVLRSHSFLSLQCRGKHCRGCERTPPADSQLFFSSSFFFLFLFFVFFFF